MFPAFRQLLVGTILSRRCIGGGLLAAYVAVVLGVPLPFNVRHHADETFPCANHGCGCASADHCWRSCCCHTLGEKLAWARQHKVRPPEFAIAAAKDRGIDLAWLGIRSGVAPSCCSTNIAELKPSCCAARTTCCASSSQPSPARNAGCCAEEGESSSGQHIVGWRALAHRII